MPLNPVNTVSAGPYPADMDAIKRKVGTKTFEQGVALAETLDVTAKIQFIVESDQKLVAVMEDEHFYVVNVYNLQGNIEGACNCEKSENFDFCLHCVALCVYANEQNKRLRKMQQGNSIERIHAYIASVPRSELEAELLKLMTENPERQQKYLALADIKHQQIDTTLLKKLIVKALPVKNIRQQAKVKAYFEQAFLKINDLIDLFNLLPSNTAFSIAEYMLWRYDTVMMKIEDAYKYRLASLEALKLNLVCCFKQLTWPTQKKAEYLYALHSSEFVHIDFENVAGTFIDDDDTLLSEEYHKLLIAHLKANGLQKSKATNALNPAQVRMVNSIANYYFASENAEKAISFLVLNSNSFTSCIDTIERCIENSLFDYIPAFLDKAHRLAKQDKQVAQLAELFKRFDKLNF